MRDLSLVLAAVMSDVWAIEPRRGMAIAQVLARRAAGVRLAGDELHAATAPGRAIRHRHEACEFCDDDERAPLTAEERRGFAIQGSVAVIPVIGAIVHRRVDESSFGGTASMQSLTQRIRGAVADPTVKTLVIDFDTPGGSVDGVPEAAAEIVASTKPIVGVANTWAASAGYWLASQCDELVVTPSGEVGSIGVYAMHEDLSKYLEMNGVTPTLVRAGENKAQTHPYFPLSDAAKADLQRKVDASAVKFDQAVAKGRAVSATTVREKFGQGLMFNGQEAVDRGMADRVATLDETISRFAAGGRVSGPRARAHESAPDSSADLERRRREVARLR
jgi:signal peptide peptidase SppA